MAPANMHDCRSPAHAGRRQFIKFAVAGLVPATPCLAQSGSEKTQDLVNLHSYQTQGNSDWTAALNQACASARRVYIPAGEYLVRAASWPSGTEIFGDGEASILRVPADADYAISTEGGPAVDRNVRDLYMHDLQIRGSADIDGFSEFKHLVSINGVTGVRFSRVVFRGFRGDGLYVGSGNRNGIERHNHDVQLTDCIFDGMNRQNRNGITVVDCDGFHVSGCRFMNMTMPKMPGAIDIEPNPNPYHVIRNIVVRDNSFNGIGGNVGVVAVFVPREVRAAPVHVRVERNRSSNYLGSGAFFYYSDNRRLGADAEDNDVHLVANDAKEGASPFSLRTGRAVHILENQFADFTHPGYIGYVLPATTVENLEFAKNKLMRCGLASSTGLAIYNLLSAKFVGNSFTDCGNSAVPTASAILFTRGQSASVQFSANRFASTNPRRLIAIRKDAAHVFNPDTNSFADNQLNGLTSFFQVSGQ